MTDKTDLQVIDQFLNHDPDFIDPKLLTEINIRGLYGIINHLPRDKNERRAITRSRLSRRGKYMGEPEIEQIADEVDRISALQWQLSNISPAEVTEILRVTEQIAQHAKFVADYYK